VAHVVGSNSGLVSRLVKYQGRFIVCVFYKLHVFRENTYMTISWRLVSSCVYEVKVQHKKYTTSQVAMHLAFNHMAHHSRFSVNA